MSILDKLASSILPSASDEDRANARSVARSAAGQGDWLSVVLDHHRQIEAAFQTALSAGDSASRMTALRRLATILTGHANAEESVLYPALADSGEKSRTGMAFEEQAMTKIQLAKLEKIDPASDEWREKLEHIQSAVLQHIYQEEGTWFPKLQQEVPASERGMLTSRFLEEYERYVGEGQAQEPLAMAARP